MAITEDGEKWTKVPAGQRVVVTYTTWAANNSLGVGAGPVCLTRMN
jgi:hypothetical protein